MYPFDVARCFVGFVLFDLRDRLGENQLASALETLGVHSVVDRVCRMGVIDLAMVKTTSFIFLLFFA